MAHLLSPRRSAHASIRGYLYQALLGVERWLRLGSDGETADAILCEGDEDLDRLVRDGIATSEQVKDYSGPLGIGDRVVRETLARFLVSWVTLRRRGEERRFVFTTTAPLKPPRSGVDVLRLWEDGDRRDEVIEGVREWTLSAVDRKKAKDGKNGLEAALAWLDERHAWEGLFEAVDWKFDAPGVERTRSDITRSLAARDVDSRLHGTLIDRLLARVLDASVRSKPEDRILTEADLDELLALTETDLASWAATPRAVRLRETLDEAEALRPLLSPGTSKLPPNAPPSRLLIARYEVVPFEEAGRQEEIRQLAEWCDGPEPGSVLLLHGQGGAGKTRLLIEWCRRLLHQGWHAGFLDGDAEASQLDPILQGVTPRLVVVDYGETRPGLVGALLHRVARLPETGGPKVRVALLARTAGAWWEQIQKDDLIVEDLARSSPDPVEVSELVPAPEERPAFVRRAAEAYAAARGQKPPEPATPDGYTDRRYRRALYLHVAALLQVLGAEPGEDRPLAAILGHERRAWWPYLRALTGGSTLSDTTRKAADRVLAVLTLVGGAATEEEIRSLVETAVPSVRAETTEYLVDLFRRLYPGADGRFILPLEPDLLGEELVREVLLDDLSLLDRLLERPDQRQVQDALILVGRLLVDESLPAALAWRVMTWADANRPLPVPLSETAATATQRVLDQYRKEHPEPDEKTLETQAALLNNLSAHLSALGHHEEALHASQEAVAICRQLAEARPDELRPRVAMSLISLSNHLSNLGNREEALEANEEAVVTLRPLAGAQPDAFRPYLALSLNNLSRRLFDLGRQEKALQAVEEAASILRQLANVQPDVFRPDFATSLNNLSNCLSGLGHHEAALRACGEAVATCRQLAGARPDAFRPKLAMGLDTLSLRLSALGRHDEAIRASEEAVSLSRQLADARPDAFTPGLAGSLNNLSVHLSNLGHHERALEASEEAAAIFRQLARARPRALLPSLAGSLTTLSSRFSAIGHHEEALDAIQEAVASFRQLADALPDAFKPDLARSLNTLANQLSNVGHHEEALGTAEEAVAYYRELAEAQPEAFRPNVARSLNDLSNRLSILGRSEEALDASQEAVATYRELVDAEPDASLRDLAIMLGTRSNRLSELGHGEEALDSSEEAVAIWRQLTAAQPEAFGPKLAMGLDTMSIRLSDLGLHQEALLASKEAIVALRQLAEAQPDAFRPNLAAALHNLSGSLAHLGRRVEALTTSEEAVRLLSPFFLRLPPAFARWMGNMVRRYRILCQENGAAPDQDLLAAIAETFAVLRRHTPTDS